MLPPDYHMHTPLCQHATGEPYEYAITALKNGLTEIGFSDHAPMPQDNFDNWRMSYHQLDSYIDSIIQVQKKVPDLQIKIGLEIDFIPGCEDWIRSLISRYSWDYVIGSVHYVEPGWDIDNPGKIHLWKKHDINEIWIRYLELVNAAAVSGLFDFIGHYDLPKKFGHRPTVDLSAHHKIVLLNAAKTNTAIEINTAGLRKTCSEVYPSADILNLALESGVKIVFGSDAHSPDEVGFHFSEALELVKSLGFNSSVNFSKRNTTEFKLF